MTKQVANNKPRWIVSNLKRHIESHFKEEHNKQQAVKNLSRLKQSFANSTPRQRSNSLECIVLAENDILNEKDLQTALEKNSLIVPLLEEKEDSTVGTYQVIVHQGADILVSTIDGSSTSQNVQSEKNSPAGGSTLQNRTSSSMELDKEVSFLKTADWGNF